MDVQLPLRYRATHDTAGAPWVPWLSGPDAVDLFAKPGTPIDAPSSGRIVRLSGRDPSQPPPNGVGGPWGLSEYFVTDGGDVFFATHLQRTAPIGAYRAGQQIGVVGDYPGLSADHVHWGFVGNLRDKRVAGIVGGGTDVSTATSVGWQDQLLQALHAPNTESNRRFLDAWAAEEGTKARFNPLATTKQEPGSTRFNSSGVQNYPDAQTGIRALVETLSSPDYAGIVGALRRDQAAGIFDRGGNVAGRAGLNEWVSGRKGDTSFSPYVTAVERGYFSPTNRGSSSDWTSYDAGNAAHDAKTVAEKALSPFADLIKLLHLIFSVRGLEIFGGFVLIVVGVLWLARAQGAKVGAGIPAGG